MSVTFVLWTRGSKQTGTLFSLRCYLLVVLGAFMDLPSICLFLVIGRDQIGKAYQTASVLFEVLCAVNKTEKGEEVAPEVRLLRDVLFTQLCILFFSPLSPLELQRDYEIASGSYACGGSL